MRARAAAVPLAMGAVALATPCQGPLVPGMDFISSSLNANYMELLSPGALSTQFVKLPAVAFTCDQNNTIEVAGTVYQVPDAVHAVTTNANSQCNEFSTFSQSSFNFSQALYASFTADAGFNVSIIPLAAGGFLSPTAQLAFGYQTSSESVVGVAYCNVTTHVIELLPGPLLTPDPEFAKGIALYLTPNPRYEQNVQAWNQFFESWGTIVPASVQFGGVAGTVYSTSLNAFNMYFNDSISIAANASADLATWVHACGGATINGNGSTASSSFTNNTSVFREWHGGSCIPGPNGCSFSQWYETVFSSPAALSVSYTHIADYIALVDKEAAAGAYDAVSNISSIAAMQSSVAPLLTAYRSTLSNVQIPSVEDCRAAPLLLPQCQPNLNSGPNGTAGMCCNAVVGSNYPDDATASRIRFASAIQTAEIDAASSAISNAVQNAWTSREVANNVTSTVVSSAFAWSLQTEQAQCAVEFVPNSVCPSWCEPVECGPQSCLLPTGGPCCLCPGDKPLQAECCNGAGGDNQFWLCPSQCSGVPQVVQTYTATWPTAYSL